jgi:hypothetical protein
LEASVAGAPAAWERRRPAGINNDTAMTISPIWPPRGFLPHRPAETLQAINY